MQVVEVDLVVLAVVAVPHDDRIRDCRTAEAYLVAGNLRVVVVQTGMVVDLVGKVGCRMRAGVVEVDFTVGSRIAPPSHVRTRYLGIAHRIETVGHLGGGPGVNVVKEDLRIVARTAGTEHAVVADPGHVGGRPVVRHVDVHGVIIRAITGYLDDGVGLGVVEEDLRVLGAGAAAPNDVVP